MREREREERRQVTSQHISHLNHFVCVCVREREREGWSQQNVLPVRNRLNRGLFANTYELHHCVCHATLFLSGLN